MNQRPRDTDLGLYTGTVKFYSKDKGYGFLCLSDGRECFFHFTGIAPEQMATDIQQGAEVSCRLWKQNGENIKGNGLKASEIRVTHLA